MGLGVWGWGLEVVVGGLAVCSLCLGIGDWGLGFGVCVWGLGFKVCVWWFTTLSSYKSSSENLHILRVRFEG